MADESRFAGDNAEMRRLERELKGVVGDLRQDLAQSRELRGQAQQERTRSTRRAEAESRARRARTAGAEEPAAVRAAADDTTRLANARERAARAQRASTTAAREEAAILRAQRTALPAAGGTTGGYAGGLTPAEVAARARRGIQTGGTAGPPGGPPPRRPAPPAPGGPEGERNLRDIIGGYRRAAEAGRGYSSEQAAEIERARQLAGQTGAMNARLQESTRAIGLSSNALQRHGYLTSEFINAARRGQVTFRELGDQVGGTIAKFGGWTLAAAAVYGVLGATAALGRGAVDSNRGVSQLSRVITTGFNSDRAQSQFRALAHEMNLPIGEVADAAYNMGKVFNDQNAALKATEQALFAVKVGELDAASATRYLNSIVNGFGLSAEQLPEVFDAINQAQNRFGGNLAQLIAGVSKAGGSFKLAGGDFRELIALITTGARLTGTSAENVGTAVSRSASVVLTKAGQDRLRAAGLNPQQDYPKLLSQAFEEAHGASRERVQEIARALVPAGGQFTRVFVPILENVGLYNRVMKEISPEKAKGSATRELQRTLSAFGEQLKAVLYNVEQLGSSLAQAGALDLLGGGIHLLNQMLHLTTLLVDQFDRIPRPLRDAVVILAEVYGLTRLLRRFDVGAAIPVGSRGQGQGLATALRRTPYQADRAQILRGLGDETKFLSEQRERVAQQAGLASYQSVRAAERHAALLRRGNATEAEISRSASTVVAREEEASRLIQDQRDLATRHARVQGQQRAFQQARIRSEEDVARVARQQGILYTPGTLERQSPTQPRPIYGPRGEVIGGGPTFIPGGRPDTAVERGGSALREEAARARAAAQRMGVTGRVAAGAFNVAGTSMLVGARGVGAIGKGIFGFARSIAASLGPLDIFLVGIGTFLAVKSHVEQRLQESQNTIDRLGDVSGGAAQLRARANKTLQHTSFMDTLTNAYADYHNFFAGAGLAQHIDTPDRVEKEVAKRAKAFADQIDKSQQVGANLYLTQISANLKRRLAGAGSNAQREAALRRGLREIDISYARDFGGKDAKRAADELESNFKARLADIRAAHGSLDEIVKSIKTATELSTFVGILQNRVALQGPTHANTKRAAAAVIRARQIADTTTDPKTATKALQDMQNAEQAILTPAEQRLNYLVSAARTPAAAGRARTRYLSTVRQALGIPAFHHQIDELEKRMRDRSKEIATLSKDVDKRPTTVDPSFGDLPNLLGQLSHLQRPQISAAEAKKSARLRRLRQQQIDDRKELEGLRRQLGLSREQFKAIELEQRKAQAAAELSLFDARTGRLQSQTADPVQSAQILASRLAERVAIVRRNLARHLATAEDLNNVIAQQNQALQQVAQARVASYQSLLELRTARFALTTRDQGSVLRQAISSARQFASYVASQGSKLDPATYRQALTAVAQAEKAYQDYVRQQAEAMVQARAAILLARADDPVEQAEIQLQQARDLVKYASDPADRIKRRADAIRAKRDVFAARAQSRFDDIEFQREMGQISAQTEISMLRSLLHMAHLTKEFRRNILRRIHAVKQELNQEAGTFDINPGDIRLPTVYEIRRAIKGGGGPITRHVNVTNHNRISLEVASGADVDGIFDALDQATGSSVRAAARSAGVL